MYSRMVACVFERLESRTLLAAPWGAFPTLIGQAQAALHYPSITGRGQSVAVIDSGVDYRHPALGGGWKRTVIAGYDFVNYDQDPADPDGHGTGVAGIIAAKAFTYGGFRYAGIARGAKIIALRADYGSDIPDAGRIEQALQWVLRYRKRYNITAVNISLGDHGRYPSQVSFGPYTDELAKLHKAGVFIAAASGNDGYRSPGGVDYPAADPSTFAVGSITNRGSISGFTSRGPDLELLAPGEAVPTPYFDPANRSHIYVASTGTSFSAPFAAAAAVLLRQANPRLRANQIASILHNTGVPTYDGASRLVYRRLNIDAAIRAALKLRNQRAVAKAPAAEALPQPAAIATAAVGASDFPFNTTTRIQAAA